MTPRFFYDEVLLPNAREFLATPSDIRLCVNVIMTMDAFFGIIHAHLYGAGLISIEEDGDWKEEIAKTNDHYRLLRDCAFALKHGLLTSKRPRLIRTPGQIEAFAGAFDAAAFDSRAFDVGVVVIDTEIGNRAS